MVIGAWRIWYRGGVVSVPLPRVSAALAESACLMSIPVHATKKIGGEGQHGHGMTGADEDSSRDLDLTCRVDLVIECEALVDGDATLRELEHAPRRLDKDHLLVILIQEHNALTPPREADGE